MNGCIYPTPPLRVGCDMTQGQFLRGCCVGVMPSGAFVEWK